MVVFNELKNILRRNFFSKYFISRLIRYRSSSLYSESDLIGLYFTLFSSSKTMIDVGAHYGESFNPYEKMKWKVYAFEPDPANRAKIRLHSKDTVLLDYAISDHDDQELVLYTSPVSTGISSLSPFHSTHQPSITVKTRTLERICEQEYISQVDFLKIDTEGFDFFVLKGFPFDRIKPRIILCEFEDLKTRALGYSYLDLGAFLVDQGYKVYLSEWDPIVEYGGQHTWKGIFEFPEYKLSKAEGWGNFIAVRKDCLKGFYKVKEVYLNSVSDKSK